MNSKSMFMLKDLNDWENCYMEELTIRINGEGENLFDNL